MKSRINPELYEALTNIGRVMVFKATFNNISVYRGGQFFLMEETRVPGENHRPAASH